MDGFTEVPLTSSENGSNKGLVAVEEPLELRLDGHAVSVLMRTPGHDEELAAGFLLTEGIVTERSQIRKIETREDENRVLVFLEDSTKVDFTRLTRHFFAGSSCGICGKATLDAIFTHSPRLARDAQVPEEALLGRVLKLKGNGSSRVLQPTG